MAFRSGSYGGHIHDDAAYEAAIQRRIRENARKGRGQRWLAEVADRAELIDKLFDLHPSGFAGKMQDSYSEWRSLTPGQETAVRDMLAKRETARVERIARDSGSQHVGVVGQRQVFHVTVRSVSSYEGTFGPCQITVMADAAGNVIVAKGKGFAERGATIAIKATVTAQNEREGVAQTVVNRPAVLSVAMLRGEG